MNQFLLKQKENKQQMKFHWLIEMSSGSQIGDEVIVTYVMYVFVTADNLHNQTNIITSNQLIACEIVSDNIFNDFFNWDENVFFKCFCSGENLIHDNDCGNPKY